MKRICHECEVRTDKSVLGHCQSASLVMLNNDPWDRFVYLYLILMSDSCNPWYVEVYELLIL